MEKTTETTTMENQMEKKVVNEMETQTLKYRVSIGVYRRMEEEKEASAVLGAVLGLL